LIYLLKYLVMSVDTLVQLDDYFDDFAKSQVDSGRYASVSEVIQAGLQLLEQEEFRKRQIVQALEIGEQSGMIQEFNREQFKKKLHAKYLNDAL